MARRQSKSYTTDEIGGIAVDSLSPEKLPETAFNMIGGKNLLASGARDVGYTANKFVTSWLIDTGALEQGTKAINESGVLQNIGFLPDEIDSKHTAKAVKSIFDAAVSFSEAAIIAQKNHKDDKIVRKEIAHEMQDYLDAGFKGIRQSSSIPSFGSGNPLIDKLDQRLTKQYEQGVMQAAASAIMSGTQYAVINKLDYDAQQKKFEDITFTNRDHFSEAEINKINEVAKNNIEPRSIVETFKNSAIDYDKSVLNDKGIKSDKQLVEKIKQYRPLGKDELYGHPVNTSSIATVAGAVTTSRIQKALENSISKEGNDVIAYDLVQQLNEYTNKTEACPETIDLAKVSLPKSEKVRLFGDAKSVATEVYIEKIFEQHAIDQTGEGIGQRFSEDVAIASRALADAISGKSYDLATGDTLHPMALISIVGEGKVVSPDARDVKGLSEVKEVIAEMRDVMPISDYVDADKFLSKMDMPASHFKRTFENYSDDVKETLSLLVPDSILRDQLGINEDQIRTMRTSAGEDAHQKIADMVNELAEKDTNTLRDYGMSANDIKLIKDTAHDITFGQQDALHQALRPNAATDLQYALLKAEGYLHELSDGKEVAARGDAPEKEDVKDAKKDTASEEKDAPEAKNAIEKFERPSSKVDAEGSERDKLEEKEQVAAR